MIFLRNQNVLNVLIVFYGEIKVLIWIEIKKAKMSINIKSYIKNNIMV